jgi:hypothetical protein
MEVNSPSVVPLASCQRPRRSHGPPCPWYFTTVKPQSLSLRQFTGYCIADPGFKNWSYRIIVAHCAAAGSNKLWPPAVVKAFYESTAWNEATPRRFRRRRRSTTRCRCCFLRLGTMAVRQSVLSHRDFETPNRGTWRIGNKYQGNTKVVIPRKIVANGSQINTLHDATEAKQPREIGFSLRVIIHRYPVGHSLSNGDSND